MELPAENFSRLRKRDKRHALAESTNIRLPIGAEQFVVDFSLKENRPFGEPDSGPVSVLIVWGLVNSRLSFFFSAESAEHHAERAAEEQRCASGLGDDWHGRRVHGTESVAVVLRLGFQDDCAADGGD